MIPEAAYFAAREAISRRGLARLRLPKDASPPDALLDPALRAYALAALQAARGGAPPPLRLTIWKGGAAHAGTSASDLPGEPWTGYLDAFAKFLEHRATVVAPKRRGWVVEPTTCPTGRRTNEDTLALHALFLDNDNRGDWRDLLRALADLDLAYVAYRSGGHSPEAPKWRAVLPLQSPCSVTDDALRAAWRAAYLDARVVLGAAGRLLGEGFDPRTDAPSIPWFITERRRPEDPPREVLWRDGAALDLARLVHFLPPHEVQDREDRAPSPHAPLPDGQLDEVSRALRAATASVPSGRRDLYLALSGALLDRGISGDDVVELIEDVSAAYPTSTDHPALHADNVRIARCTAAAHAAGRPVTRIGTLNELFPDVAHAIDEVLPDAISEAFREAATRAVAPPASLPQSPPEGTDLSALRKIVVRLRSRRRKAWEETKDPRVGVQYLLLHRLLSRKPLAVPPERDAATGLSHDASVSRLAAIVAWSFPERAPADAIREVVRGCLSSDLPSGETSERRLDAFLKAYVAALGERLKTGAARVQKVSDSRDAERRAVLRRATRI